MHTQRHAHTHMHMWQPHIPSVSTSYSSTWSEQSNPAGSWGAGTRRWEWLKRDRVTPKWSAQLDPFQEQSRGDRICWRSLWVYKRKREGGKERERGRRREWERERKREKNEDLWGRYWELRSCPQLSLISSQESAPSLQYQGCRQIWTLPPPDAQAICERGRGEESISTMRERERKRRERERERERGKKERERGKKERERGKEEREAKKREGKEKRERTKIFYLGQTSRTPARKWSAKHNMSNIGESGEKMAGRRERGRWRDRGRKGELRKGGRVR